MGERENKIKIEKERAKYRKREIEWKSESKRIKKRDRMGERESKINIEKERQQGKHRKRDTEWERESKRNIEKER